MAEIPRASPIPASRSSEPVQASDALRLLLKGTAMVAGLTHIAFLTLFHWAGVEAMAIINVGSVLCYVWTFWLAHTGRIGLCWLVTAVEVVAHAILAVWVIGWASGFHFYILLVIPVAVITDFRPLALKVLVVSALTAIYLGMDMLLLRRDPLVALPNTVLDGLHYFNVLGTVLILIFLAGYYHYLMSKAEANLRAMATTDPLTQLRNRRAVIEAIRDEELRMQRAQTQMSFVLCDLDHFKLVNDTYGHDAGDEVLKAVSRVLSDGVREVDHLARWGGEEFLLVLPGAGTQEAQMVAERLRQRIEALRVKVGHEELHISMTFGVSARHPDETSENTISRADQALYEGKHAGRNRVVLGAQAPTPVLQG
ncbi:MAG: GGDEF domain-containing protein [Pseudomonadota bacterium]